MASLGHIAVGMAATRLYGEGRATRRSWLTAVVLWSLLSMLPDADVVGFSLGVDYGDEWGHRGATHSLAFSFALGTAIGLAALLFRLPAVRTGISASLVLASHALLDTLTDGGLGCALLWPFDLTRYFAPWNPIPVAPIGLAFFSPYGLMVAAVELLLFAPLLWFALSSPRVSSRARPADAPSYTPPLTAQDPPRAARQTPRSWWLVAILSFAIAGYALSFYARRDAAFPGHLAESFATRPWGIYTHVLFGALALALAPFQFRRGILARHRAWHRNLGRVYIMSAMMTGVVGLYMALHSFGGMNTHLAFGTLGGLTAFTTAMAYTSIRGLDVTAHREWMIRSFALVFGAVTLRIELPLLIVAHSGEFAPAYAIVAWLSWVPNLIWAEWYVRHSRRTSASAVPRHSMAV